MGKSFHLLSSKTFLAFTFFSLLSLFIMIIWFKDGQLYGGGDVGVPTLNPSRFLSMVKYPWWEAVAPGFLNPSSISVVPFEIIWTILQYLGFSNQLLQSFTFFLLFFLMGFGMYLFLLSIFKEKYILALLGALFYLFNPYMLIQIWHRFIHNSMFFVAFLPFMIIFWRKWADTGKVKHLFIFLLINLFGSLIYGNLSSIITLWLLLGGIAILEAAIPFSSKRDFLIRFSRLCIGFTGWILTNCWWVIPTLFIGSGQFSQQLDESGNLASLIEVSKYATLPFSLQMIDPYNLYQQLEFGGIYLTPLFKLLPWLTTTVVFIGLISSLKQKIFSSFGLLTLLFLFLAKGASAPLGNIFIWGFKSSFFWGAIRNPSEKVGIIVPFLYTVLFVLGFVVIEKRLIKYRLKQFSGICLVFLLILPNLIFSWPIFTGKVFGTTGNPAIVNIPDSYKQIDTYIKNQNLGGAFQDTGKILHLPLSTAGDLAYKWKPKYHGVDPNAVLFNSMPSIARNLNLPKFDDPLKGLSFIFMYPYSLDKNAILKALKYFNVRFIILHKDSDYLTDEIINPAELEKTLDSLSFLVKLNTSGDLILYKIKDQYFEPKIIISENPVYVRSGGGNNIWLFQSVGDKSSISDAPGHPADNEIIGSLPMNTIFADKTFRFYQASSSAELTNTFQAEVINKLNLILQQAKYYHITGVSNAVNKLLSLTQLLKTYTDQGGIKTKDGLNDLKNEILEIFQDQQAFPFLQNYLENSTLQVIFQEQLLLLDKLKSTLNGNASDLIKELSNRIIQTLIQDNIFPINYFTQESDSGVDMQVFNLSVPSSSNYKIYFTKASDPSIFDKSLSQLQFLIDGKKQVLESRDEGNTLSFGIQNFKKGIHEISYPTLFSTNLLVDRKEWRLSRGELGNSETLLETIGNEQSVLEVPIKEIERRGEGIYYLNMEVMLQNGQGFYIQLLQDSDPIDQSGRPVMQFNTGVSNEEIGEGWKNLNFNINLRMTTKNANLRFILIPKNTLVMKSSLSIKNLSFQRILNDAIFLEDSNNAAMTEVKNQVTKLTHPNPIIYSGEINITKPSFLLLKETYNEGWELKINNEKVQSSNHFIGDLYGNAWFIDKPGRYSFEVKFGQIKYNIIGFWVSTIFFSGIIIAVIFGNIRKKKYE